MVVLENAFKAVALIFQLVMVLAYDTRLSSRKEYDASEEIVLHINKQKTVFLYSGQTRLFLLLDSVMTEHPLSVTVIPCSSSIEWSVRHRLENETGLLNMTQLITSDNSRTVGGYQGKELYSVKVDKASKGLYIVQVSPLERETFVHMYASMDPGGPYDLTYLHNSKLKLIPRRKKQLTVRWEPSLVNPHHTHYCLVVNTRRDYPTLCEAEGETNKINVTASPVYINFNATMSQQKKMAGRSKTDSFHKVLIICVEQRTHLTLTKLELGQVYYFNLFATNIKTNLTVPYGSSTFVYNYTVKTVLLKDGKPRSVNLNKYQGLIHFKFKVSNRSKELYMYVIACGGIIDTELVEPRRVQRFAKRKSRKTTVHGFHKFNISKPEIGKYTLKISAPDADELNRISNVEVFATQHRDYYPLPALPAEPLLYEYTSQKACNNVTIGWIPTSDMTPTTYCVYVRENYKVDYEEMASTSYQCNLGLTDAGSKTTPAPYCQDMSSNSASVTTHTVTGLTPGRSYTIQVTVRRETNRRLSYMPLKVYTKRICD